jgi:hypothetical protein
MAARVRPIEARSRRLVSQENDPPVPGRSRRLPCGCRQARARGASLNSRIEGPVIRRGVPQELLHRSRVEGGAPNRRIRGVRGVRCRERPARGPSALKLLPTIAVPATRGGSPPACGSRPPGSPSRPGPIPAACATPRSARARGAIEKFTTPLEEASKGSRAAAASPARRPGALHSPSSRRTIASRRDGPIRPRWHEARFGRGCGRNRSTNANKAMRPRDVLHVSGDRPHFAFATAVRCFGRRSRRRPGITSDPVSVAPLVRRLPCDGVHGCTRPARCEPLRARDQRVRRSPPSSTRSSL